MSEWQLDGTGISGWPSDGHLPPTSPEETPAGYKFSSLPRLGGSFVNTLAMAGSGTVQSTGIWLPQQVALANAAVLTGATAASGPTHQWVALTDYIGRVLAVSADATSAAIAASTFINYAFSATLTTPYTGWYYLDYMVTVSTTMPTLTGLSSTSALNGLAPILGGTSSTGQTTAPALNASLPVTAGASLFFGAVG